MHQRHFYLRKRTQRALEPYPASKLYLRILDASVYVAGVVGPIVAIPQVMLIYGGKDATGVSPIAWFGWAAMNIPWLLYGIAHKEKPIVLTQSLWFCCNLLVAIGAVIY
jgi:uncharacterized protein with PQ loop repeat